MAITVDRSQTRAEARCAPRAAGRHRFRPRRAGAARWLALVVLAVVVAVIVAGGVGPVRGDDAATQGSPGVSQVRATPGAPEATRASGTSSSTAQVTSAPEGAVGSGRVTVSGRGGRPSGLAWHSGVFSHDAQRTVAFEKARGRPVDVLAVFPTRDSWQTILQDWWMGPSAVPAGFGGTLAVGVPLFPTDGSMQRAAAGEDVQRWEELGRLIASRYPDAWVRPGWEFNIPNWPWAATPENVEAYKAAFRHAVAGLRRGGPNLRIVFNPNEGRGASLPDATMAYPGDDVVDVIGLDAYDWYPAYTPQGWQEHRTKDQGWNYWADFARAHGKRFALPEWGVMTGSDASGGDNPAYVEQVLEWMGAHADLMAFDAYFEETQDYCRCALSLNPKAQAAYTAVLPRAGDPARLRGAQASATDPPAGVPASELDTTNAHSRGPETVEPAPSDPSSTEPASSELSSDEPSSTEPASTEPASTEPASTEPLTGRPTVPPPPDVEPPDVPGEFDGRTPKSVRSPGRGRYGRESPARTGPG